MAEEEMPDLFRQQQDKEDGEAGVTKKKERVRE
jgi:hypothetical protein